MTLGIGSFDIEMHLGYLSIQVGRRGRTAMTSTGAISTGSSSCVGGWRRWFIGRGAQGPPHNPSTLGDSARLAG
jgi:hypothetical protein